MTTKPCLRRIMRDFAENALFFRRPRRAVTRHAWCSFFLVSALLCAAAYLAMSGIATLLQTWCTEDTLRHALGDAYYTVTDGGPTGFTAVGLLLFLPFMVASIRRMRDAGLSPWWLLLPPALMGAAIALFLLYCICYNLGFVHSGDISDGGGAWLAVLFFALAALSYLSTLALLLLMAVKKTKSPTED